MRKRWLPSIGPGALVAAAFVGPGTVTLCTLAGVGFGFDLLWAMLLSIVATIVLQEMAARLGLVTQRGLAEVIRAEISSPLLRRALLTLMLLAIVVGNASYQAGNISGGVLGLEAVMGDFQSLVFGVTFNWLSVMIGAIAFFCLYSGTYKHLEKLLVSLVVLMSLSFVVAAIATKPDVACVLRGAFRPSVPSGSLLTIIGLIGTTVVPYNLFLHASLAKEKWGDKSGLKAARQDAIFSISLGGLVSMAIIVSAAASPAKEILSAIDLADGLTTVYGPSAKYFLSFGLFAAGLTSAITAPLAAAYVAKGCLGWSGGMQSKKFRLVWMFILALGVLVSSIGLKPIELIQFAQIANGFLLPIIAGLLIWVANRKPLLGEYVNSRTQNLFAFIILLISLSLGTKAIGSVFGLY